MTDKQLAASRANGRLTKGPVTEQGKRNSTGHNTRHGLLSRTVVLEEESEERFLALLEALTAEYLPSSATELALVETMAVARWRELRVWGAQKTAMDRDIALQDPSVGPAPVRAVFAFRGSDQSSCSPEVLLRYEIAFDRQFSRALTHLRALQSKRAGSTPQPYCPENPSGHTWKNTPLRFDPSNSLKPEEEKRGEKRD